MKKQNKQMQEQETVTTEVVAIENVAEATVTTTKRLGRPVVEGSVRQLKLAAQKTRIEMNGGVVKLGRPVVGESKRQQQIQERLNKMAAGVEIKRGRPKMNKEVVA